MTAYFSGMVQYHLPPGMRYTTLEERRQFYTQEFDVRKVTAWFRNGLNGVKFAAIMGRHTGIFLEKYRGDAETTIIIDEYKAISDVRMQVVEFLPEAVYYDRNLYDQNDVVVGQELAFDLDPENIECPVHGTLADKMALNQGLGFCEIELDLARKEAIALFERLERQFSDVRAVYSGRGFHLHVFDSDAYKLNFDERLAIAQQIKAEGFHIDEWVTSGESRLIRLPYSLNGLVSRIVLPLKKDELESFDAFHDKRCLPQFLTTS
jgi:DNA primase catalytic subunit